MKTAPCIMAVLVLSVPAIAYGYQYVPTETEWATWPEYCKARYVTTTIGAQHGFKNRLSSDRVEYWRNQLQEAFAHVHHHCAGLVYAARAVQKLNPADANRLWDQAREESTYTYQRTEPTNWFSEYIAVNIANADYHLGNRVEAKELLSGLVSKGASTDRPYVLYAMILSEEGNIEEAISILESAQGHGITKSPELEYILGLFLYRTDQLDKSFVAAQKAYSLGYPLPALRDHLIEKGYSFK